MGSYAKLVAAGAKAKLDREAKGQTQANRNGFAVEDDSRGGDGFDGVPETMTEIEERPSCEKDTARPLVLCTAFQA